MKSSWTRTETEITAIHVTMDTEKLETRAQWLCVDHNLLLAGAVDSPSASEAAAGAGAGLGPGLRIIIVANDS